MLTKFISVSETRFQNTEAAFKNQQASIQGLETQIGQLAKLISERPQGSLPSNTKSNPMEQLNVIAIQDEDGLVAKPRPEMMVSKGKNEEIVTENVYEPCSNNNKGPIYEEWRLQIEELDDWWRQKSRTPNRPKSSQDELNTSPHQLKVGDKVLLDAADPCITTSETNEEIPLTVLSVFPYGIVEVNHPEFGTFKGHGQNWQNKMGMRHARATRPCPPPMVDTVKTNMGVELCTQVWEKRMKQDTAVYAHTFKPHGRGTNVK
ncbi:hypothetical protein GOBAR_AA37723 [Gossypium barbadense]|uniref:Uncharacterized protein n=1 Tax=Gossypium barbadense TaxID=3634 RepID=A0A2P5VVW7_GOSBA|nr:hypothetical protein GOBAR_AA37723 [Gossypium barbadense]